jgi:hypothetical protein
MLSRLYSSSPFLFVHCSIVQCLLPTQFCHAKRNGLNNNPKSLNQSTALVASTTPTSTQAFATATQSSAIEGQRQISQGSMLSESMDSAGDRVVLCSRDVNAIHGGSFHESGHGDLEYFCFFAKITFQKRIGITMGRVSPQFRFTL